jgi:hypothetical protein
MFVGDSGESSVGERSGVVGKVGGAEAGEEAEGEIEAADEELRGEIHNAGGNAEVGDEPEGFGRECGVDASDKGVEFGLGEAVEEEVSDDEVVGDFGVIEWEGESVCVESAEARGGVGSGGFAAFAEEFEHGGADVYDEYVDVWVRGEEFAGEATVSVAQDEGVSAVEELWEVVSSARLEGFAEGEVFEPTIGFRYRVEVGFGVH